MRVTESIEALPLLVQKREVLMRKHADHTPLIFVQIEDRMLLAHGCAPLFYAMIRDHFLLKASGISPEEASVSNPHQAKTTPSQKIPVLVITGPVGVGKTTVAAALSELLAQARLAHAVIDLDWLRWCYPSPAHDPFQLELGIHNLTVV